MTSFEIARSIMIVDKRSSRTRAPDYRISDAFKSAKDELSAQVVEKIEADIAAYAQMRFNAALKKARGTTSWTAVLRERRREKRDNNEFMCQMAKRYVKDGKPALKLISKEIGCSITTTVDWLDKFCYRARQLDPNHLDARGRPFAIDDADRPYLTLYFGEEFDTQAFHTDEEWDRYYDRDLSHRLARCLPEAIRRWQTRSHGFCLLQSPALRVNASFKS